MRAGKLSLSLSCDHASDVFYIAKRSTGALCEVWHGQRLSACSAIPPPPPWLATPEHLARLEPSDGQPIWMSIRDGACFFDQLKTPEAIRSFLGRPYVHCHELCAARAHSDGIADSRPFTMSELKTSDFGAFSLGSQVFPLSCAWPMGHSWSSTISQHTMTSACRRAGLPDDGFLCKANGLLDMILS